MSKDEIVKEPEANGITFDNVVFKSTYAGLLSGLYLIIHQGGTWSGKTFNCVLAFFVFFRKMKEAEPMTLSIVGPTFSQLRRGAWKDFNFIKEKMPGYITSEHASSFTYKIGAHTIEFFSTTDNVNAADKVRTGKRDYVLIDEANLIDWNTADLLMGKSAKGSVIAYNPYSRFWLHEMILPYMDESKYHFRITTFKDNKHLEEKTLEWLENKKINDPDNYRVLGEGKLGHGKGLIFTDVTYVQRLPDGIKCVYGLDPGYTNDPTALVKVGKYHGELWGKQLIYETGIKKPKLVKIMIKAGITEDDIIVCDKDFSLIDSLLEDGFNVIKANKGKVAPQLELLKEYKINITQDSLDWQKEQLSYRYELHNNEPTKEPNQKSGMDHCWDAFRYACEQLIIPAVANPKAHVMKSSLIRR